MKRGTGADSLVTLSLDLGEAERVITALRFRVGEMGPSDAAEFAEADERIARYVEKKAARKRGILARRSRAACQHPNNGPGTCGMTAVEHRAIG